MREKRRLLDFVCSNSQWRDGELVPNYQKPFDLLAITNAAHQKEKAVSGEENGFCPIWLPFMDDFRTVLTVSSDEILNVLTTIREVRDV
jgi:hypothetical protein